jgi:S1-C subfamily serine protease
MNTYIKKVICLFIIIAFLVSGCATPMNVSLKPRIDRLGVRQIQLSAALVVPSSIRKTSFSQQDSCAGKTFIFQTGEELEKSLLKGLYQAFDKITVIPDKTLEKGKYDLFIEPSTPIITLKSECGAAVAASLMFSFLGAALSTQTVHAEVGIEATFFDRNGELLFSENFKSKNFTKNLGGLDSFEGPVRDAVEEAFEDAIEEMVRDTATSPQLIAYTQLPSNQIVINKIAPPGEIKIRHGGTGFLFSDTDYIITNYHVVKGANSIVVKFTSGESISATVVTKDSKNDIAILKLHSSPNLSVAPIKIGNSSQAKMGQKIFTIGYPASNIMGVKPKYSEGVINSMTGIRDDPTFFQISVPIQPGNSGGPLFNDQGEVIGITTSSMSTLSINTIGAIPQNVNYAIKSSFVKNILSTVPELMTSNTGIVVVPNEPENSLPNFIEQVSKNIVLIEAK